MQVQFTSRHKEDVLRAEDEHPDFIHSFHGFSPAGDITGDLVYVNYGRSEDIKALQDLGVSLAGKIAISRSQTVNPRSSVSFIDKLWQRLSSQLKLKMSQSSIGFHTVHPPKFVQLK